LEHKINILYLITSHAFNHVSDDLRRTPETPPSNPRDSIEPRLRTTELDQNDLLHFYAHSRVYVP